MKNLILQAGLFVLIFLGTQLVSTAEAGRMKEIHFIHLEAIAMHLYGQPDTDGLETRNTAFETPEAGYFTAVSSEVQVYSSVRHDFEWVKCTTMIERKEKSLAAGVPVYDYSVAKTICD